MTWLDRMGAAWTALAAKPAPPSAPGQEGEIAWADPTRLLDTYQGVAYSQYNPSKLVTRQGLEIYDKMRLDDQVRAALTFKKHAVLAGGWEIASPKEHGPDWEPTAFLRETFDRMDGSLYEALLAIMTAFDYGYSVTEKVYAPDGSTVRLTALKTRKPHSFDFAADIHGNLKPTGLMQRQTGLGSSSFSTGVGESLPREKFVLFINEMEFGNWYGKSDLEAAYRPWLVKDHAYRWLAMLLERLGIPPIFALYNPDLYTGGVLADLKKIFANLQAATSGVIPRKNAESLEFWTPQIASQLRDVFLPALERFDGDIARAVLLPQLLGFTSDSDAGSFARANVHQDSFMYIIRYVQGLLADRVMNEQVIRPLLALNFANLDQGELPVFMFKPLDVVQRQGLTDRWLKAVETGVIIPVAEDERYLREVTSFPERDIPDDQTYTVRGTQPPGAEGQDEVPGAAEGEPAAPRQPVGKPKDEEEEPAAAGNGNGNGAGKGKAAMKALSDEAEALIMECERLAALGARR